MNTVLANAILAFLESREGGTLADLRRFLVEKEFRDRFLGTVTDPEIVYYWQREFPLLAGRPQGPILTRLDTFLRPKMIRHMVSQKENRLDFGSIMNGRKILLAKLSQGLIGEENSYLLGALIVSKLNQTAMSRQEVDAAKRPPFYVYIDEFHNFLTPSVSAILSGARKYGLGLILAHQELHQLWSRDTSVASAVISNPFTRVCFRVGDMDAKKLSEGFSFFDAKDLQKLGVGQALCRLERADWDFNLQTSAVPDQPADVTERRTRIRNLSRSQFAVHQPFSRSAVRPEPATTPQSRVEVAHPVAIREPIAVSTPAPQPAGRGGAQHKYLQELIRRWAESRDYRAVIERGILDGLGSVDVSIERDALSIACEICVTTSTGHEVGNLRKCLAAGFMYVVAVGTEQKALKALAKAMEESGDSDSRLRFFMPEDLFAFLAELDAKEIPPERTVRGYRVKVKVTCPTESTQKLKSRAVTQTVLSAMRRLKNTTDKSP